MNWKEHAHLFIGFQVITSDVLMNIYGIERWISKGIDSMVFILEKDSIKIKEGIDSCTLIARKIEDMTDEEKMIVVGKKSISFCEMRLSQWGRGLSEPKFSQGLKMIEIGVYPFDQSHFEDGTVIDAKTTN